MLGNNKTPPWVGRLPLMVSSCFVMFGILALALVVCNTFHTWTFLLLGIPLTMGTILLCAKASTTERPASRWDIYVIMGTVLWALLNIPFHTQHLLTDRDPATYTNAGIWLVAHSNLHIPKPAVVSSLPSMHADSLGFGTSTLNTNELYAQGSHLLPALLGVAGKLFGTRAVFSANIVFGAVALASFYAFAKQILKNRWAAFATLALSISLPFLYFSRDTYTEPLALAFTFTALSWIHRAVQSRTYGDWLITGIAIGATALVRPDAYIPIAAFEAFLILHVADKKTGQRRRAVAQTLWCVLPAGLLMLLGLVDLTHLSSGYYRDLREEILEQLVLVLSIAALAMPAVALYWRAPIQATFTRVKRSKPLRAFVVIGLSIGFTVLLVRALLLFSKAAAGGLDTMSVQAYGDQTTILWILWYIGPVLAFAGTVMFVIVWGGVLQGELLSLLPLLLVLSADCALYLLNPRITPDQVWASRRFLPVIFPGFILLGTLGLQHIRQWQKDRSWLPRRFAVPIAITGTIALLLIGVTSLPFWTLQAFAEESSVHALCRELPANALVVWVGSEGGFATEPTNLICHVTSLNTTATGAELAALLPSLQQTATSERKQLILGVDATEADLLPEDVTLSTQLDISFSNIEHTYKKFPLHAVADTRKITLYRYQ